MIAYKKRRDSNSKWPAIGGLEGLYVEREGVCLCLFYLNHR